MDHLSPTTADTLDEAEQEMLTSMPSDEALEAAAGIASICRIMTVTHHFPNNCGRSC
jgi:hypothetical protein